MRIVSGLHNTCRRTRLCPFGFPDSDDPTTIVKAYRDRMKGSFKLIPPVAVTAGPILENVDRDDAVDLFKFPVPMIHEKDGGRYIGTYCVVIMQDPDTGWVNLGTYRVVAHDPQQCRGVDFARQARPPDPREIFRKRTSVSGRRSAAGSIRCCSLPAATRSSTAPPNTPMPAAIAGDAYEPSRASYHGLPCHRTPRSCWKASFSPTRPAPKARSANSPATMPATCATSRWCGCAGSTTATIRS